MYTRALRFVVVRSRREFCFACPIFTYSGRATLKRGVRPEEHGIAYSYGTDPTLVAGEVGVKKMPIAVVMAGGEPNLAVASRIYYGVHHPIQYNVKVKNIGLVLHDYLPALIGNWKSEDASETKQAADVTATAEDPELPGIGEVPQSEGRGEETIPSHPPPPEKDVDRHMYHARKNVYGYDATINPHMYHPVHNLYGYHPTLNTHGYHPSSNPYSYHPKHNPYGYHPQLAPFCYHPQFSLYGYHGQQNTQGYHPESNPYNYHPSANPFGYHPTENPYAFHPRQNPKGYHPTHNTNAYHPKFNPKVGENDDDAEKYGDGQGDEDLYVIE